MSVWERMARWLGRRSGTLRETERAVIEDDEIEADAEIGGALDADAPDGVAARAVRRGARADVREAADASRDRSSESVLEEAASPLVPLDRTRALSAINALVNDARELDALRLGRRVLAARPGEVELAVHLAELAASRGDDTLAAQLLDVLVAAPVPASRDSRADAAMRGLVLAGELAERRGDVNAALAAYERALARDVDYPRAKERAARLREARGGRSSLAGATLLADGALAQGRYRVLRELGRGGAGTVFAVRDLHTERVVALKLYHGRSALDRERLRGEARVAATLEHPGVVRIFDLDESLLAIAMEHVPGGSVRDALRRGAVPFVRARRWLLTAADTLAHVHARGFVHRDLKPSNWLVRADDSVVLTDFGLSRRAGALPGAAGSAEAGGEGTLAYMPPEQRAGGAADPAADVHALGATMRELLSQASGAVPPELLTLALSCTARDPSARPTLDAVRDALRASPA